MVKVVLYSNHHEAVLGEASWDLVPQEGDQINFGPDAIARHAGLEFNGFFEAWTVVNIIWNIPAVRNGISQWQTPRSLTYAFTSNATPR